MTTLTTPQVYPPGPMGTALQLYDVWKQAEHPEEFIASLHIQSDQESRENRLIADLFAQCVEVKHPWACIVNSIRQSLETHEGLMMGNARIDCLIKKNPPEKDVRINSFPDFIRHLTQIRPDFLGKKHFYIEQRPVRFNQSTVEKIQHLYTRWLEENKPSQFCCFDNVVDTGEEESAALLFHWGLEQVEKKVYSWRDAQSNADRISIFFSTEKPELSLE